MLLNSFIMPRTSLNGGAFGGWLLLRFCVESACVDGCAAALLRGCVESTELDCGVSPEGGACDRAGEDFSAGAGGRLGCAAGAGCATGGCFAAGAGSVGGA